MKFLHILLIFLFFSCDNNNSEPLEIQLREEVTVQNDVFVISYNEIREQPNWIEFKVRDITKVADRGGMDFYVIDNVRTSDNMDYKNNHWDKGHMAPAGSFTDSWENLYTTFSFLNCAFQEQNLNRGEWRLLEEQEREWDDEQNLTITVELIWEDGYEILPSGGHIPTHMSKTIYFEQDGNCRKFVFPNQKPTQGWEEYEVTCTN